MAKLVILISLLFLVSCGIFDGNEEKTAQITINDANPDWVKSHNMEIVPKSEEGSYSISGLLVFVAPPESTVINSIADDFEWPQPEYQLNDSFNLDIRNHHARQPPPYWQRWGVRVTLVDGTFLYHLEAEIR